MKLQIRDLRVSFGGHPVASVPELAVDGGEIVGLAGESGSGKSMTILAVLGLAETAGAAVTGSVRLDGQELVGLSGARLRAIRGARIAALFQSPSLAFNPVFRVGAIVSRALRQHGLSAAQARERAGAAMRSGCERTMILLPPLRQRRQAARQPGCDADFVRDYMRTLRRGQPGDNRAGSRLGSGRPKFVAAGAAGSRAPGTRGCRACRARISRR